MLIILIDYLIQQNLVTIHNFYISKYIIMINKIWLILKFYFFLMTYLIIIFY